MDWPTYKKLEQDKISKITNASLGVAALMVFKEDVGANSLPFILSIISCVTSYGFWYLTDIGVHVESSTRENSNNSDSIKEINIEWVNIQRKLQGITTISMALSWVFSIIGISLIRLIGIKIDTGIITALIPAAFSIFSLVIFAFYYIEIMSLHKRTRSAFPT